ncbi:uncharacterized protein BX663DRAFT_524239 [Cokeromyces recurvatus]|uniref:uncharacterized protein n=1 Tax=Cokeromyces recurvatus TaxID=90255 RepID=UPI00221ECE48|nr:uncharacterized protein BX663DRAFT_524239 [Cokeromyces recurvatus]KAI7898642.1 hypothetical protein BX663DRAFT_524239 [Cokeromyces recurvatus]
MFTKIINNIRDTFNRTSSSNKQKPSNNTELRRCSITEELENNGSTMDNHSTTPSVVLLTPKRNHSISGPIPIRNNDANNERRRSSTLFGISNVSYDDYVQKDLISSSWS